MNAKSRGSVLATVLVLLSVPVAVAVVEAVAFSVANRPSGAFVSSGQKRDYVLYVPRSYDHTKPTSLVISMHGAGLWGAAQREISQWNRVAEARGFIVVYPSAATGDGPMIWRVDRGPGLIRDIRFIAALIDTLEAHYHIDPSRIYANGLSNGGGMAFVLSCALSDRIAAVGMVAAAQTLPWTWCTDHHAVPMMAFHGTADRQVPYTGGRGFPDVSTWVADWSRRNQCGTHPRSTVVAADVTRLEYTHCADAAAVVLYTIQGGGHSWPGGKPVPEWWLGSTSNGVDATQEMWAFFRDHPLPLKPRLTAPR